MPYSYPSSYDDLPTEVQRLTPAKKWQKVEVVAKLPQEVRDIAGKLSDIIGTLREILAILKDVLNALLLLELANLSAAQAAILAAIKAIEAIIEALVKETGVYWIFIPPQKVDTVTPQIQQALRDVKMSGMPTEDEVNLAQFYWLGDTVISDTLNAYNSTLARSAQDVVTSAPVDYLNGTTGNKGFDASAGNAGFLRVLAASLADTGDDQRPQLQPTDYVAGATILAGVEFDGFPNLMRLLALLLTILNRPTVFNQPGMPTLKNLKCHTAYLTDKIAIRLSWDTVVPLSIVGKFNVETNIKKIVLIRSRNKELLTKTTPQSIFPNFNDVEAPFEGKVTAGSDDTKYEIVRVIDNAALFNSGYIDLNLEKDKTYYYAGYLVYESHAIQEDTVFTGASTLSNVTFTYAEKPQKSGSSVQPDWHRSPSLLELIPGLKDLIASLILWLDRLGDIAKGYIETLQAYLEYLNQAIQKYVDFVDGVLAIIQYILSLLTQDIHVGIYLRPFFGIGGTGFMLSDLAQGLADTSDTNAPPFNKGNEFVTGIVLMGAAPSPAALDPFIQMFTLFFGSLGTSEKTIIQQAVESVDRVLDEAEQSLFDEKIKPTKTVTATASVSTKALVGANDDGTLDLNCPDYGNKVTLGDDLKPIRI